MANNAGKIVFGRADISISPWVTAGGAGSFVSAGHTEGDAILELDKEDLSEGSEQVLGKLFQEPIGFGMRLKYAAKEASLDLMGDYLQQIAANLTGTAPNKTLLIGEPTAVYKQIKIVTTGEATLQSGLKAIQTITLYRCAMLKPEPLSFAKGKVRLLGFTWEVMYDESMTTLDKYGKIVNASGT